MRTEPDLVAELLDLLAPHPWIRPAWQKSPGGRPESTSATFARALGLREPERSYDYLVTTRLDNDDALRQAAGVRSTKTALAIRHTTVFEQDGPVFTPLTQNPMWLENIHGQYVMNFLVDQPLEVTPSAEVAASFSLPWPADRGDEQRGRRWRRMLRRLVRCRHPERARMVSRRPRG